MSRKREKPLPKHIKDQEEIDKKKKEKSRREKEAQIELGKGAFSTVTSNNQIVATKKIQLHLSNIRSVINQINIMRDCNHPNITQYIGSTLISQNLYALEMQRAICSLQSWIGKWEHLLHEKNTKKEMREEQINIQKPLKIDLLIDWLLQLCLALSYLKRKHILHRDIKTTNILIFENDRVKLCDFGVGVYEDNLRIPGRKKSKETELKNVFHVGTPCYMAPQLVQGNIGRKEGVHERSRQKIPNPDQTLHRLPYGYEIDIWALGVTFYEVLFEKFPFKGDTKDVYFQSILEDQPHFPIITSQNYQQTRKYIKYKYLRQRKEQTQQGSIQNQRSKLKRLLCAIKMMLQKQPQLRPTPQDLLALFQNHIDQVLRHRHHVAL